MDIASPHKSLAQHLHCTVKNLYHKKTSYKTHTRAETSLAVFAKKATSFGAVGGFFCVFFAFYPTVIILLEQSRKAPSRHES